MPTDPHVDERIRIMIADDDENIGAALVELIHAHPELAFAGFAYDADSAVELAEREQPDLAIVDVRMPGGGIEATIGIRRSSPGTQVIAFSADGDEATRRALGAAGAGHYLVKGTSLETIVETLLAAAGRTSGRP